MFSARLAKLKFLFCAAVLLGLTAGQIFGSAQQPPASRDLPAGTSQVKVKQEGATFVSVRAKEAPLNEIAAELSRQMKAPVILSRVMAKQKVTVSFEDLPLETALQMLAPVPYIHYELQGGSTPICREIFLNAYNELVPVAKLDNKNVSFVMQGNTETTEDSKDDPLQVIYRDQRLSVSVKKQSLTAVLDRLAMAMGVNLAMKQDTDDTVDLNFKDVSLEDSIAYFPPSVHLHVRKDLQRLSTVPLSVEFVK